MIYDAGMARRSRKAKHHLGKIQRDILDDLSASDLLYGFFLSARSTTRMMRLAREHSIHRQNRKRALKQLEQRGYIRVQGENCSITKKGRVALGTEIAKTRALLKHKKWDKKWRIVVYDIPQAYAPLRSRVRGILKSAGFVLLQQSIWVFPHECRQLMQLIKEEPHIAPFVLYGVLESIESEKQLRERFKL